MPEGDGGTERLADSDSPSPGTTGQPTGLEKTQIQDLVSNVLCDPGDHDDVAMSATRLMWLVAGIELVLIVIALLASRAGFHDLQKPLTSFLDDSPIQQIGWGALFSVALVVLIFGTRRLPWLRKFHELIDQTVAPMFRSLKLYQVAVISLAAGVGEELFFRWCLQGGLTQYLGVGFAVAVSSLVFGLLHWLSFTYFVIATLMGVVLAWIYLSVGPLAAIVCHAFYDFLAIQKLVLDQRDRSLSGD